jgi:hypothetical protein
MKQDGMLVIEAETEVEAYALTCWMDENVDTLTPKEDKDNKQFLIPQRSLMLKASI